MLIPTVASGRFAALVELRGESYLVEERIRPTTAEMNGHPLRVNKRTWQKNVAEAEETAWFNITYCHSLSKLGEFRPNSAADCRRVLGIPGATDKDTLLELANQGCLLAEAIINARSAISRWSQLKKWKDFAEAGIVQPYWDSMGCPHGRYTSENPCLNNRIVPIRETIEPDLGWSFLSMDLGQAEYVVWASLSHDEVLGAAFRDGVDFHTKMAQDLRELVPQWFPPDLRQAGKTINFALLYQMKAYALARKLGCTVETAERIIDAYYGRVPQAALYIDDTLARAEEFGYVETFFGRRRYCPEYQGQLGPKETHEIQKTLWNHVNAGTAAEITKKKQIAVWEALRRDGFGPQHVRLSLNIYDECIWQVRDDVLGEVKQLAEEVWTRQEEDFLPFRTTIQTGKTWQEASR